MPIISSLIFLNLLDRHLLQNPEAIGVPATPYGVFTQFHVFVIPCFRNKNQVALVFISQYIQPLSLPE